MSTTDHDQPAGWLTMRIWKRFNLVSLLLALILTGGGYVVWKWHTAKFKAQARVQVAEQEPRVLFQTVETETRDDYRRYQSTQLALVKSRLVLNAALQDQKVYRYRAVRELIDPIKWLQDNLEVQFVAGSEVMEIALSGDDPDEVAGLVNAVKKAYMDEIVLYDVKRRAERHATLKSIQEKYRELLKERREMLRKRPVTAASDDRLTVAGLERPELLSLHHGLWTQRIDLQLERAEAEARLARRKKAVGPATDPVRKEIDRIEDLLAGLTAQEKVIDEGLEQMAGEIRRAGNQALEREQLKIDIASIEDIYRKVTAEVEAMNVELEATPRIRTIEDAVPPHSRW